MRLGRVGIWRLCSERAEDDQKTCLSTVIRCYQWLIMRSEGVTEARIPIDDACERPKEENLVDLGTQPPDASAVPKHSDLPRQFDVSKPWFVKQERLHRRRDELKQMTACFSARY